MPLQLRDSLAMLILSAGVVVSTSANAIHTFTDLGPQGSISSTATDINNLGQVIGSYTAPCADVAWKCSVYPITTTHAVWEGGVISKKLDAPAYAINNSGQIAGGGYLANANPSISSIYLNTGKNYGDPTVAWYTTINNLGQMAGTNSNSFEVGLFERPVVLNNVNAQPVELPNRGTTATVGAINDNGILVGSVQGAFSYAYMWDGITDVELPSLNGYHTWDKPSSGHAIGINNANQVVGVSDVSGSSQIYGAQHATLWNGTTPTDLGALTGVTSMARDINNAGQIVGNYHDSSGRRFAALWHATNSVDLNTLLDADTISKGWILTDAIAINDNGWIVGNALDAQGATHAFLLSNDNPSPVPIPAAAWLLGTALFGLVGATRKRKNAN